MVNRKRLFREAFIMFHASNKSVEDYMQFMYALNRTMQRGSGITWNVIEEIVRDELK